MFWPNESRVDCQAFCLPNTVELYVVPGTPIEIVEPLADSDTKPVADRLEVAGADMLIAEPLVPDRVRLIPE